MPHLASGRGRRAGRRGGDGPGGCAEASRTRQIFAAAGTGIVVVLLAMVYAVWSGIIEIVDQPDLSRKSFRSIPASPVAPMAVPSADAQIVALPTPSPSKSLPSTRPKPNSKPLVVTLWNGRGLFNTGVWPGWGGPDPKVAHLQWAANGVAVHKRCEYNCEFTYDQLASADGVVVETVNHAKFGHGDKMFPWPIRSNGRPIVGAFYVEPEGAYPGFQMSDASISRNVEFSATYSLSSDVPVTLMCPWGVDTTDPRVEQIFGPLAGPYLNPAPLSEKDQHHAMVMFSDRGIDAIVSRRLNRFVSLIAPSRFHLHAYSGPFKTKEAPPGVFDALPNRLALLRTYRVAIVAQSSTGKDWIDPELSHALVSGAVPVVWGPSNLKELLPSPEAAIDAMEFGDDIEALWAAVKRVLEDDAEYERRQAWRRQVVEWMLASQVISMYEALSKAKSSALHPAARHFGRFAETVALNCVHYAECRICEKLVAMQR
jgi:hypothetical protein